jgi:hypothetical protein
VCDDALVLAASDRDDLLARILALIASETGQVLRKVGSLSRRDELREREGARTIGCVNWLDAPHSGRTKPDLR